MKKLLVISDMSESVFNNLANAAIANGYVPLFDTYRITATQIGSWVHSMIFQKETAQ